MPVAISYPGVYIQEIPSGVRTITGVATSITAFIGRAERGPTNQAVVVNSFGDFEAVFGGLWNDSTLGYSVRDFFLNGGGQAIVVRLYNPEPDPENPEGTLPPLAQMSVGTLNFVAANEGSWGVDLRLEIDRNNITDDIVKMLGVPRDDVFNLRVTDTGTGNTERHLNLTVQDSPRRVDKVLMAESALLRYGGNLDLPPGERPKPAPGKDALGEMASELATAEENLVKTQNKYSGQVLSEAQKKEIKDAKADRDDARADLDEAIAGAKGEVSDGLPLTAMNFLPPGGQADQKGLYALEDIDLFNLLCIPPYKAPVDNLDVDPHVVAAAAVYCEKRRAMLLLDAPRSWTDPRTVPGQFMDPNADPVGTRSSYAALYFPRLMYPNPLHDNRFEVFSAVGAVAGIYARTDATRGFWKAPAGLDATLIGVPQLSEPMTDLENGSLNQLGINALRAFPIAGRVVWGARTLRGADQLADEYKYVPVRRTALFIEESLFRGLKWVVFEPNDEPLWAQIRLNVGAFMHDLFRQGAFQGRSPRDAYFVKCDHETTTQTDINLGIVNVVVGFAPLKPAEFVIVKIQQIAGQIEV